MSIRGSIIVAAVLGLHCGCASTPTISGRLDLALDHYESARFDLAQQQAQEVIRAPAATAAERERATYLAGLSAFRLGDLSEAELRLNSIMATSDRALLASAQALLGQIRLEQKRPREAAALFESAARSLSGEDARQARRYAAIAHYEAGDLPAAQRWYEPVRRQHLEPLAGGFTLQVGAFQDRYRAEQAATEASEVARGYGLGTAGVRSSIDSRGRRLYLVQFGRFPTRQAAAQARLSIGRLDYIVAPLPRE